jgi:hypothetical protein
MSTDANLEDRPESRHPPNSDPVGDSSCGSRDNTTPCDPDSQGSHPATLRSLPSTPLPTEMRDGGPDSETPTEKSADFTAYNASRLAQTALMALGQQMPALEQENPQSSSHAASLTDSTEQTSECVQASTPPALAPARHMEIALPVNGSQLRNPGPSTPDIRQSKHLHNASQRRLLSASPPRTAPSLPLPSTQVPHAVQQLSGPALSHLYNASLLPPLVPEASKPSFPPLPPPNSNPPIVVLPPELAPETVAATIHLPPIQECTGISQLKGGQTPLIRRVTIPASRGATRMLKHAAAEPTFARNLSSKDS